jgi:hypothetical protein
MKKRKLVKALLYRARICDSMLEHTHGMYYFVSEVFVPKAKICMNEKGFVFLSKKPRSNDIVEIKISQKLVADAKKLMMIETKTKPSIEKLFSVALREKIDNCFNKQEPIGTIDLGADDKLPQTYSLASSIVLKMNDRGMDNPAALT